MLLHLLCTNMGTILASLTASINSMCAQKKKRRIYEACAHQVILGISRRPIRIAMIMEPIMVIRIHVFRKIPSHYLISYSAHPLLGSGGVTNCCALGSEGGWVVITECFRIHQITVESWVHSK
jgi:hypothetical protein